MSLTSTFKNAVQKVSDFHLNRRGRLGLVFGLAVGIGSTYTGIGQELVVDFTNAIFDLSKENQGSSRNIYNSMLQSFAAVTTIAGVLADVGIHKIRTRKDKNAPSI